MAVSALAFLMAMPPAPVEAAATATATTTTKPAVETVSKKAPAPDTTKVPAEKKAVDTAKDAVAAKTKKLNELSVKIKEQKAVDSKAISVVNKADTVVTRAQKAYDRENQFLVNMSPKTSVMVLQTQKNKVGTCFRPFSLASLLVCVACTFSFGVAASTRDLSRLKLSYHAVNNTVTGFHFLQCCCFFFFFPTADTKASLDDAVKEYDRVKALRRTSESALNKLTKEYETTEKALAESQTKLKKAETNYKNYQDKMAAKAKKEAQIKAKKEAEAKKKEKKAAEAKKKADKKAAEAKKKAEEKERKQKQEAARKAAKKAKEDAAKAAKIKAEKIKKTQEKIEALEKEKRDLVIKDAPMAKISATESKLAETKAELTVLLKTK